MQHKAQGFTLIELLVVIAIIAVLSVVVILTLNPAQLLAQARDSTRISDMSTLKSALSLYLADVASPSMGTALKCYTSALSASGILVTSCNGTTVNASGCRQTTATSLQALLATLALDVKIDGTGWIPVNLGLISAGSPVASLPVDPQTANNSAVYFYTYGVDATNRFKLTAHMESTKFQKSGTSDVENTDGGGCADAYEVGTNLAL